MGSKEETVQKVDRDPWKPAQPFIMESMNKARNLRDNGPSMVAPFNPIMNEGYDQVLDQSRNADYSLTNAGGQVMADTIAGKYIGENPYLDAAYNKSADRVSDRVSGLFSGSGRYGSGAHQRVLGDSLSNLATDLYGGAYLRERQNQLNASNMAPGYDNSRRSMMFGDANRIIGVGQDIRSLDAALRGEPWQRMNNYNNIALGYGNAGGTTNSNTVTKTGGLGPVVGGIMGGLNMASQFMAPMGSAPSAGGFGGGGFSGGGNNFGMIGNSMTPKLTYNGPTGGGFYG